MTYEELVAAIKAAPEVPDEQVTLVGGIVKTYTIDTSLVEAFDALLQAEGPMAVHKLGAQLMKDLDLGHLRSFNVAARDVIGAAIQRLAEWAEANATEAEQQLSPMMRRTLSEMLQAQRKASDAGT